MTALRFFHSSEIHGNICCILSLLEIKKNQCFRDFFLKFIFPVCRDFLAEDDYGNDRFLLAVSQGRKYFFLSFILFFSFQCDFVKAQSAGDSTDLVEVFFFSCCRSRFPMTVVSYTWLSSIRFALFPSLSRFSCAILPSMGYVDKNIVFLCTRALAGVKRECVRTRFT